MLDTPPCCSWDFPASNPAWCEDRPSVAVMKGEELQRGRPDRGSASGGFACTCSRSALGQAPRELLWEPTGCLLGQKWNASRFCELLSGRKLMFIGDSTMQQTFASVASAVTWWYHRANGGGADDAKAPGALRDEGRAASVAMSCAAQLSYGKSDTLVGRELGRLNRGRAWHEWVTAERPALVVLGAGAHVYGVHNFSTVLREVAGRIHAFPHTRVLWKTQQPGGCAATPLASRSAAVNHTFWRTAIKVTHARCTAPGCHHNAHGTLYNWPDLSLIHI